MFCTDLLIPYSTCVSKYLASLLVNLSLRLKVDMQELYASTSMFALKCIFSHVISAAGTFPFTVRQKESNHTAAADEQGVTRSDGASPLEKHNQLLFLKGIICLLPPGIARHFSLMHGWQIIEARCNLVWKVGTLFQAFLLPEAVWVYTTKRRQRAVGWLYYLCVSLQSHPLTRRGDAFVWAANWQSACHITIQMVTVKSCEEVTACLWALWWCTLTHYLLQALGMGDKTMHTHLSI